MMHPSWMTLHGMAYCLIELHKPFHHNKTVIHEGDKYTEYDKIKNTLFTSFFFFFRLQWLICSLGCYHKHHLLTDILSPEIHGKTCEGPGGQRLSV